ncbi:hypothetical protein KIPB_006242 [Kipferlia bialata]|uniref:Uncharacterized protein n=1 Tax=Kipferlia bialata TaxID=797122 RepID=A0A9K3CYE6_9EUKA|nr:hypothetical protein KIPB_006242 [Kipferlia bialata]|eukprot:g6242.t1
MVPIIFETHPDSADTLGSRAPYAPDIKGKDPLTYVLHDIRTRYSLPDNVHLCCTYGDGVVPNGYGT